MHEGLEAIAKISRYATLLGPQPSNFLPNTVKPTLRTKQLEIDRKSNQTTVPLGKRKTPFLSEPLNRSLMSTTQSH
eukprot:886682-Rhodomonas_salina.4